MTDHLFSHITLQLSSNHASSLCHRPITVSNAKSGQMPEMALFNFSDFKGVGLHKHGRICKIDVFSLLLHLLMGGENS